MCWKRSMDISRWLIFAVISASSIASGEQPPASPPSQHGIRIDSRARPPPSPDATAATLSTSSSPAPISPSPWSSPPRQQRHSALLSKREDG
ncbi:unnamed protein product, partial [Ectocarpus sp. 8 AP-2014]